MPDNNPLVSVGVITYNRPEGLRRTLECITGQTYKNLEIIVGDNCSPDDETENIVKSFQQHDPRITYYRHKENMGMGYNAAFVLEKAIGEYILHATDDDEWFPTYIEKCIVPLIEKPDVIMCMSQVIAVLDPMVNLDKDVSTLYTNHRNENDLQSPYWKLSLGFHTYGLPLAERVKKVILNSGQNGGYGIFRTQMLRKLYFDPRFRREKFGADRTLLAYVNIFGSIYQISEYLFVYHYHEGAASKKPIGMKNEISRWEYYGLRINPLLTAYLNMIIDSLSWPVSIPDHIRIIGYYLARMAKAKIMRYTMKTPFVGTPLYDYKPPEYPYRNPEN